MKRGELTLHRKVVNIKHGTEEEIIKVNVLMKDSVRGWVPAVVYEGIDRYTGALVTFCKAEEDFLNEFKPA